MNQPASRFAFKSPGLEVEFEGPEAFISAQVEHLKERIAAALARPAPGPGTTPAASGASAVSTVSAVSAVSAASGAEPQAAAGSAAETGPEGAPTLDQFYRRARSREGRGALQETILIFAYFLKEYRGKDDFSIDNLNACFSLVGAAPPRSLANTLGIMKRNQKFFHSGARRGHYALTEKGIAYVKRLIGA